MHALLVAIVAILLFYLLWRQVSFVRKLNQLPGFRHRIGLIGDMGIIMSTFRRAGNIPIGLSELLSAVSQFNPTSLNGQKGGLWVVWIGPSPFVMTFSPEMAEYLFSSNTLIRKGTSYNTMHSWLGTGLLTSWSSKWFNNRKMLTPAFHFKILESFLPIMNRNAKILIEKLKSQAGANGGLISDFRKPILLCALDVICETAMGKRIYAQSDPEGRYIKSVYEVGDIIIERVCKPWTWVDSIYKWTPQGKKFFQHLQILKKFTDDVIQERMNEILSKNNNESANSQECDTVLGGKKKEPFMDTLILEHLKRPSEFTLENIREEVDTFMFEGHDTTAWGVIWSTFLLGLHPDIQSKLQEEVDLVYDNLLEDQELTLEDLRKLAFTEAVIKESQRLYPSVPVISRTAESDIKVGDYTVPAGSELAMIIFRIHRDPVHWPEPEKFDPERFMSNQRRHPYAFVPFSAGPRNCIGQKFALMEEKALVASIFRNFTVRSLQARDDVIPAASLISKVTKPLRMELIPRKKS